jgi:hypothetical protein
LAFSSWQKAIDAKLIIPTISIAIFDIEVLRGFGTPFENG